MKEKDKKPVAKRKDGKKNSVQKPSENKKAKKNEKSVKAAIKTPAAKKSDKRVSAKKIPPVASENVINVKADGKQKKSLKIRFLGGVGEIGKNMTALEFGKDIIVIDAGLSFPGDNMPGVDLVIPDITYLSENKSKIRGIVITHGHEDHIGSLPYILKDLSGVPVFGTKLTLTLIENKLKEQNLGDVNLNCIKAGGLIKLGCFTVEFINVNHSIAGAVALAVTTPCGVVFHTREVL